MRTLKFLVNGQLIRYDPECDFSGIVSGTEGYLQAEFNFSEDWDDCIKIARFWRGNEEHAVFIENDKCDIPSEVLNNKTFRVSVIGKKEKFLITTNAALVRQEVI